MKKILSAALAGVMAVTLLAGCGSNGGTTTTSSGGGKADLMIGLPGGDAVTAYKVVENFKEARKDQYNITTDEASWSDFNKKLLLQFVSKNDVTPVFFTDSMQAMTFGAQGAVLDLKSWVDENIDSSLYNKALFAITDKDGHLWGVPHALNSIAIIYNKAVFDEKGVAYPTEDWTFDDMLKMAKELTFDRDGDGETDVYGINYTSNITQGWLPFMTAVGVNPYKDDFRNSNLDDPKVKEAMEYYYSGVQYQMEPAELSALGNVEAAFAQGKIAMAVVQSSSIVSIEANEPDFEWDAQIMPIGWGGARPCVYVPNTWEIYSGVSEDVKAACLDWLGFYLSEESQMIEAAEGPSGFPIMLKALDSISAAGRKPEHIDAFYKGIDTDGITLLENPASASTRSIIDDMTNKIRNGEDIDSWIATAHQNMQDELNYFYENQ